MVDQFDWRALVAAALLVIAPTFALAQEATPPAEDGEVPAAEGAPAGPETPAESQALDGWNKFCNPDPVTQEEGCVVVYRAYQETPDGPRMIGQVSLSFLISDPEQVVQSITVPIGVLLGPGILLTVDEGESASTAYTICDPQYCYAESQVEPSFINRLKGGGELVVSFLVPDFENGGAQQLDLPVTLFGFTAAYDGPGRSPEEAQALQDRAEAARQRLIEQQQQLNETPAGP